MGGVGGCQDTTKSVGGGGGEVGAEKSIRKDTFVVIQRWLVGCSVGTWTVAQCLYIFHSLLRPSGAVSLYYL